MPHPAPTPGRIPRPTTTGDLYFQNRRAGGVRVLSWKVKLLSMTVLEDYEESDCEPPNEVFLQARAYLHQQDSRLISSTRFPSGAATWDEDVDVEDDFGGAGLILGQGSFPASGSPESPLIYVEIAVWEKDEDKDLMGIHSRTFYLADLLSTGAWGSSIEEVTDEGDIVRLRYQVEVTALKYSPH